MDKDLRMDAEVSSIACRLIDILDEVCHIFVRFMFIVGGKRNIKIGGIHIGLSDYIQAQSIIPGNIYQHRLTAIAGINHIPCMAALQFRI